MVDLISNRTIDITKLALDGLMMRQKAITANTANVMTPDYVRKEVNFESQLKEIVEKDDLKTLIKTQNSVQYNPSSLQGISTAGFTPQSGVMTPQMAKYLQSDIYGGYKPQIVDDIASGADGTGNNVDMEKEIMDMAKVGTQYTILSNLQSRQFRDIGQVIKGEL